MRLISHTLNGHRLQLKMSYPAFLSGPVTKHLKLRRFRIDPQEEILSHLAHCDLMRGAKLKSALAHACQEACGGDPVAIEIEELDIAAFLRRSFRLVPTPQQAA